MVVTNRAHLYSASGPELKREVITGAGGDKRPIQVRQVGGSDRRNMASERGKLLDQILLRPNTMIARDLHAEGVQDVDGRRRNGRKERALVRKSREN